MFELEFWRIKLVFRVLVCFLCIFFLLLVLVLCYYIKLFEIIYLGGSLFLFYSLRDLYDNLVYCFGFEIV